MTTITKEIGDVIVQHGPLIEATQEAGYPAVCTPAQGLVALYAVKGITEETLLATIDSIADPVERYTARIAFSRATEWRRDSQAMQTLAVLLSLTESDLDELFTFAVTVNV